MAENIRFKAVKPNRNSIFSTGKYRLKYLKGTIVEAKPSTLGIFVFEDYEYADNFSLHYPKGSTLIIEVEVFGDVILPEVVCCSACSPEITRFYKSGNVEYRKVPIPGTECYPKILVLE